MHARTYLLATAVALLAPATATAATPQRLEGWEARSAAVTLGAGRTYELARKVIPSAEYGRVQITYPGRVVRLGRRAVLTRTTIITYQTHADEPAAARVQVDLLVRERPRSGRIIVRPL